MWGGVIDWIKSINNSFRRHLKTSTKRFYLYFYFSLISFKFKCRNFRWHLYRMCGWQHVIQHVETRIFKIRTYWMLWHCSFSNLFKMFVFLFSFILFLKCAPEKNVVKIIWNQSQETRFLRLILSLSLCKVCNVYVFTYWWLFSPYIYIYFLGKNNLSLAL